jgi:hypothetical protein
MRQAIETQSEAAGQTGPASEQHVMEKITRTVTVPRRMTDIDSLRRPQSQPQRRYVEKDTEHARDARDFLEDMLGKPEANDWHLSIYRSWPTVDENKQPILTGKVCDLPLMEYDQLKSEIVQRWGGGCYRCVFSTDSGSHVPHIRCVKIQIPIENCPARAREFEKTQSEIEAEAAASKGPVKDNAMSDALQETLSSLKDETALDQAEERRQESKRRRIKKEMEAEIEMEHLRQVRENQLSKNKDTGVVDRQIEAIRSEMRDERKLAETKFEKMLELMAKPKDDTNSLALVLEKMNSQANAMMEKMSAQTTAMVERMSAQNAAILDSIRVLAAPKEDKTLPLLIESMRSQQTTMMEGFKAVAAPREDKMMPLVVESIRAMAAPKDTSGIDRISDVIKMGQESSRQVMEMVIKGGMRENNQQSQLLNTLLANVLNPAKANDMGPDMILKLIGEGRKQMREVFDMTQGGGGGGEEGEGGEGGGGLADKIFGGIQTVLVSMAGNPALAPFLGRVMEKLVGSANPTPDEQRAAAMRMAQQQQQHQYQIAMQQAQQAALPRPVNVQPRQFIPQQQAHPMPPPVMSRPLVTPPPVVRPVQGMQSAQGMPPAVQRQAQASGVQPATKTETAGTVTQITQASQVTQVTQVQGQPPATPSGEIPDVGIELEGEVAEINPELLGESGQSASGGQTVDQNVAPEAQFATDPKPTPDGFGEQPEPNLNTPEERLKYYVTDSMKAAVEDLEDQRDRHVWPLDAKQYWNGGFLKTFAEAADDVARIGMIAGQCESEVWQKLDTMLRTQGGAQVERFMKGITELVEMVKAEQK